MCEGEALSLGAEECVDVGLTLVLCLLPPRSQLLRPLAASSVALQVLAVLLGHGGEAVLMLTLKQWEGGGKAEWVPPEVLTCLQSGAQGALDHLVRPGAVNALRALCEEPCLTALLVWRCFQVGPSKLLSLVCGPL